jgi:hypothetical protein
MWAASTQTVTATAVLHKRWRAILAGMLNSLARRTHNSALPSPLCSSSFLPSATHHILPPPHSSPIPLSPAPSLRPCLRCVRLHSYMCGCLCAPASGGARARAPNSCCERGILKETMRKNDVPARVSVCACMRAYMHARARTPVCVCVCVCVRERERVCECVCVCVHRGVLSPYSRVVHNISNKPTGHAVQTY